MIKIFTLFLCCIYPYFCLLSQERHQSIYDYQENTADPTHPSYFYNDSKNIEESIYRMEKLIDLIYLRFDCHDEDDLLMQGYDLSVILKLFEKEISGLKHHLNSEY
jgi:hypothetical protein